jgi:hypothetical protein
MKLDYGPGDLVVFANPAPPGIPVEENAPTRPVMVCHVEDFASYMVCGAHGLDCPVKAVVSFVDWPKPLENDGWAACCFRKIDEPGEEIEKREFVDSGKELETVR